MIRFTFSSQRRSELKSLLFSGKLIKRFDLIPGQSQVFYFDESEQVLYSEDEIFRAGMEVELVSGSVNEYTVLPRRKNWKPTDEN